jgi:hypothetical protein
MENGRIVGNPNYVYDASAKKVQRALRVQVLAPPA